MEIDCLLSPADIAAVEPARLVGVTAVVFDVLRATSSLVTALAHGTREVRPVRTIDEAREVTCSWPGARLAGERHGDPIVGFDFGNSPLEFMPEAPARLVTTTTNGTIALRACAGAEVVIAASLLNLGAVANGLRAAAPGRVLMVCAGTFETAALEDIYAAGSLIDLLGKADRSDAAETAMSVGSALGRRSAGGARGLP